MQTWVKRCMRSITHFKQCHIIDIALDQNCRNYTKIKSLMIISQVRRSTSKHFNFYRRMHICQLEHVADHQLSNLLLASSENRDVASSDSTVISKMWMLPKSLSASDTSTSKSWVPSVVFSGKVTVSGRFDMDGYFWEPVHEKEKFV